MKVDQTIYRQREREREREILIEKIEVRGKHLNNPLQMQLRHICCSDFAACKL